MTLAPDLPALLRAHGVSGEEQPIVHDGYSGAPISVIESDGARYLIKRLRPADDWIARETNDLTGREAQFAASDLVRWLPAGIGVPSLGAARDGDGWVLLMRDIGPFLIPDDGSVLSPATLDDVLARMAQLHAAFWELPLDRAGVGWTSHAARLGVLSRGSAGRLKTIGVDVGAASGWELFDEFAPAAARELARRLFADPAPLLAALDALPPTLLHGDLRLANMGLGDGKLWLFDWAIAAQGPVALELAWFLAVNSSRVPWPLDDIWARYCEHLAKVLGEARSELAQWDRQMALTRICGLLLYGWGKANDAAAGHPEELRWWCEGAADGARLLVL